MCNCRRFKVTADTDVIDYIGERVNTGNRLCTSSEKEKKRKFRARHTRDLYCRLLLWNGCTVRVDDRGCLILRAGCALLCVGGKGGGG